MIKREEYYKIISDCFGQLRYAIEYRAKQNLLDINVVAEDFVSQVLNKVHDWSLKNLNSDEKNYKAVDIGDKNNGIVIQVTSTRTKIKVQETLRKADEKELYKKFSQIKMFIITHKQKSYKDLVVPKNITFDWKKDIWDWSDINDSLKDLSDEKLIEISKFIQGSLRDYSKNTVFTDEATLKVFRQYFNSGMLKDNFLQEGSMPKFFKTLEKHIELITEGKRNNKTICKSYFDFDNPSWKNTLENVHNKFIKVRKNYIKGVQEKAIDLNSGFNYFDRPSDIPYDINKLRKEIVENMNNLFLKANIKPIEQEY